MPNPFSNSISTLLVVAAIALLVVEMVLIAVVTTRRPSQSRRTDLFVVCLCAGTPLVILGLMLLGVHAGRRQLMAAVAGIDPSQKATLLSDCAGLCVSETQMFWGGFLLALSGLFGSCCTTINWFRTRPAVSHRALRITVALGLGGVLMVCGVGILTYLIVFLKKAAEVGGVAPEAKLSLLTNAISSVGIIWNVTLAAAILTVVAAAASALRSSRAVVPGNVAVCSAVGLLVVGGVSFALTRGHAADVTMKLPTPGGSLYSSLERDIEPPKIPHAGPLVRSLIVTVSSGNHGVVALEGSEVATVQELIEESDDSHRLIVKLKEQLEVHKQNWKITHPNEPFAGDIGLVADHRTPARALQSIFRSMTAAGYRRLQLASYRPISATSRVLGDLKAQRGYAVRVILSASKGSELALDQTYADLAKIADAAAAKNEVLQIALAR